MLNFLLPLVILLCHIMCTADSYYLASNKIKQSRDEEVMRGEKIMQQREKEKEQKRARKHEKIQNQSSSGKSVLSQNGIKRGYQSNKSNVVNRKQLNNKDNSKYTDSTTIVEGKSFALKTVWGQSIINCRPFNIDTSKMYAFLGSFTQSNVIPTYPSPEIAFLGRSNVGKSSLLNTLTGLNKKIAVESKTPGRTQCINLFKCSDKEGDICIFVDLPGYGFAKMSKAQQALVSSFLFKYLTERGPLKLAILLVDIRRELQEADADMIRFLNDQGIPYVVIATKSDKLNKAEIESSINNLKQQIVSKISNDDDNDRLSVADVYIIPFSSITGEGKRDVWRAIRAGVLDEGYDDDGDDYEEDGGSSDYIDSN